MARSNSFLGRGWSFPPAFNKDRHSVRMVETDEDIRQSLFLLLSTTPGERITNLNYGCNLQSVLFDPINGAVDVVIRDLIERAVLTYEPRIILEKVKIDKSQQLDGVIHLSLTYIIRNRNVRNNIVFPFYQIEGTNITSL
ncbi:MAG: GPW/gp25 family protein [Phaeodactylibacter sp.]|nr:GPW/gp25 family protein [Phaeodactylibacter sp.]